MNGLTVVGVPQLLARLVRAAALGEAASTAAKAEVAQEVEAGAQQRVPVVTGTLRDSIQAQPDRVVATAPYAGYVEFGTAYMTAEPYMRPAADEATGSGGETAAKTVMEQA